MRLWAPAWFLFFTLVSSAHAEAPPRLDSLTADLEFLTGDPLRGRGSATPDEHVASAYVAARLRAMGVPPAGDGGAYLQEVRVQRPAAGPGLVALTSAPGVAAKWAHGEDVLFVRASEIPAEGTLVRGSPGGAAPPAGSVVYLPASAALPGVATGLLRRGAVAVLIAQMPEHTRYWADRGKQPAPLTARLEAYAPRAGHIVLLGAAATRILDGTPEGARVRVEVAVKESGVSRTFNVIGRIPALDRPEDTTARETVMISAHLDHLGVDAAAAPGEDAVYNGADDDASGVAAVLALAEMLQARRGRRDVLVALFGSEELGGLGSEFFTSQPTVPLDLIVAALQFEMVGRPDPTVGPGRVWLTGYERSDLGPLLARHGAPLLADARPEQSFYERSDNYRLAQKGVVAHTVSSFGLHADYHQTSDELRHLDLAHLQSVVRGMFPAVRSLIDEKARPSFAPGKKP